MPLISLFFNTMSMGICNLRHFLVTSVPVFSRCRLCHIRGVGHVSPDSNHRQQFCGLLQRAGNDFRILGTKLPVTKGKRWTLLHVQPELQLTSIIEKGLFLRLKQVNY
jgi:hypothetical protein